MAEMKDTIITLYVDTEKIISCSTKKKDRDKLYEHILLADNHFDLPGKSDFVSKIKKKSKISWVGGVMNINKHVQDFVIIKKIIHKKKKSIIKINPSKDGAGTTHVDGKIGSAKPGTEEEYSIRFMVNADGIEKTFTIDPKIRMR